MRKGLLVVTLLTGVLMLPPLAAADSPSTSEQNATVELDEVVVTADRSPVSRKDSPELIVVVTSDDIEAMHASSTGEVLEQVAGVTLESGTGIGFPKRSVASVNGLPAQYVLVLVNGQVLLSEHVHTGQNLDLIPPESIERIEIIKTTASAQYGSDAIGGVINIITRRDFVVPTSKVYFSYGQYASMNTGASLSAPVARGVKVTMFADLDRSDGVPILAPAHRIGKMGYSKFSTLNNLEFLLAHGVTADLYFNYIETRMDWADGEGHSRLLMPKADLKVKFAPNWSGTASLEYTSWDSDLASESNRLLYPKAFASWDSLGGRNQLMVGGDYRHQWFQRDGLDRVRDQGAFGLFAHDRFALSEHWSLSASVRMDKPEGLGAVLSPKIAVLYRPVKSLGIRASVGRGYHAPTVQELYEQAYGHGGTALRFGNEDLRPETSTAVSLGLEFLPCSALELFVDGYFYKVDNFITLKYIGPYDPDPTDDEPATQDQWIRSNMLEAYLYGGETSFKWRIASWVRLAGGYSYGESRESTQDKQMSFHPGHTLFGRLDLQFPLGDRFHFRAFTKASVRLGRSAWNWKPAEGADQDDESGYITNLADYQLLDAGVELVYRKTTKLYLTATNLLGQDIEKLDDALMRLDGEPVFRAGLVMRF